MHAFVGEEEGWSGREVEEIAKEDGGSSGEPFIAFISFVEYQKCKIGHLPLCGFVKRKTDWETKVPRG